MTTTTKIGSLFLVLCLAVMGLFLLRPTPVTVSPLPMSASVRGVPTPHPTPIKMHLFTGVQRLNQVDPHQYTAQIPYATWWASACSAAVMAEALNAYRHAYRIADVLVVEASLQNPAVITANDGLLYPGGLDRTLRMFGFQATPLPHPTLGHLEYLAQTEPIIINFPPSTWAGGHFLIVTGGDSSHVTLVDSSRLDMQSMSMKVFLSYWRGLAFVVTPLQQEVRR